MRDDSPRVVHVAPAANTVEAAIEKLPGAEAIKLAPSMRGDKRVAVRFNLVARKAAEEAPHEDYSKKFEASENLKFALSGDTVAENQQPLGKPQPAPKPSAAAAGSAAAIASTTQP